MDSVREFFDHYPRLCLMSRVDRLGCNTSAKSYFARNYGIRQPGISAPRGEGSCDMGIWLESGARSDCGDKSINLAVQLVGGIEFP